MKTSGKVSGKLPEITGLSEDNDIRGRGENEECIYRFGRTNKYAGKNAGFF